MIDAFIFDLDGVITDTAEYHYLAWKELANKIGIEIDREFNETLKGVSRMESLERILVHGNKQNDFTIEEKEKMANDKNMYYVSLIENITPKDILPGISKLLENIKSNNLVLNNLKLVNYFDFIADASKCKNSKPAPDIFLMALNGLNVEAKNCIGIEDAYSGIEAINTSGMYSVGVGDKETLKNANLVVEDTTYLEFDTLMDIFNK